MSLRNSFRLIVTLAMAWGMVLFPWLVAAQTQVSGSIAGVVKDTTGAVLPGVTVEAASPALIEKLRVAVTDDQGQYKILDLRPGVYTVTFTLPGFATFRREGIELSTGFTAIVNGELRVGSLEETVTVTGASPVVDTQNVRTQSVLTRDIVDALPTNRAFRGFAALTVGVQLSGGVQDVGGNQGEVFTSLTIHGSRSTDVNMTQDGMRMFGHEGAGAGGRSIFINEAAVQETTLQTSGISAESNTGGVTINVVPKDGGNVFSTYLNTSYAGPKQQASNLGDELRARGVTGETKVKKIYDFGVGVGGPFKKDRLWFYGAQRWWGAQNTLAGIYFNRTQDTLFFTPDLSRPGYTHVFDRDTSLRLTWQAAMKHRVTVSGSTQRNCNCYARSNDANRAMEATNSSNYFPVYLVQSTWKNPATSRLLLEAGGGFLKSNQSARRPAETGYSAIAVTDITTGFSYGAKAGFSATDYTAENTTNLWTTKFAVSYVTGSHAFKTGIDANFAQKFLNKGLDGPHGDIAYSFRNCFTTGCEPVSLTQWATPRQTEFRQRPDMGVFVQDQWTIRRLTLNLGGRFDYISVYTPAAHAPAGRYVGAFDFPQVDDVPKYRDFSPRLGASYDLFGTGKTAVKTSFGRYVAQVYNLAHPSDNIVLSATRTWNDANRNFVPDCGLSAIGAGGECGALNNVNFGKIVVNRAIADDVRLNYRAYNWQFSAVVQHELRPNFGVTAGYFYTSHANFTVTDNLALTPADFDPYCVTVPVDPRLPGGGGNQLCGLYDVKPAKFGAALPDRPTNIVSRASAFGEQTELYRGVDVSFLARFGQGGIFQGGVSSGESITDNCFAVDSPPRRGFCRTRLAFANQTQVKLSGLYPLPWGMQTSATFQNLPGIPIAANLTYRSADIADSLGRNLSSGANGTVTIPILQPNMLFEPRLTQVDVRLVKIFNIGRARVQGKFDIYNLFNEDSVLIEVGTYGPTWQRPINVLGARLFKFGAQVDF